MLNCCLGIYLSNVALIINPMFGIISGAADEAAAVFDEGASLCIQKKYLHRGLASQSLQAPNEEHDADSNRIVSSEDVSPRKSKHIHGNNLRDISGNSQGATYNHILNGGPASFPYYSTPSPMAAHSQVLCIYDAVVLTLSIFLSLFIRGWGGVEVGVVFLVMVGTWLHFLDVMCG